jgi:hypothetical protein
MLGVPLALLFAFACSGTTSTSVNPITGIVVRAETLTTGRGCGTDPTNVFKYVVVVFGYSGAPAPVGERTSYTTPVAANVFDCFTDGAFVSLLPVQGSLTYRLEVYVYNEPAYTAGRATIDTFSRPSPNTLNTSTDTSALKNNTTPAWTTQCTATQQTDVEVLALCDPLSGGLGGVGAKVPPTKITLGTTSFHLTDGRTATCAQAGDAGTPDAGNDAGTHDASTDADAGDGSVSQADAAVTTDAGPPVTFTTARVRYRIGAVVGPTVDLACPAAYLAEVQADPATYTVDVGVIDSAGNPLGTAECSVTTQTGATSSAVCP